MSPFLLLAALVPAAFLMVQVYRLDRIEKEPAGLLLKLALFGALSGLAAGAIEGALTRVLDVTLGGGMLRLMLENFLGDEVETSPLALMRFAASTFSTMSGSTSELTITSLFCPFSNFSPPPKYRCVRDKYKFTTFVPFCQVT